MSIRIANIGRRSLGQIDKTLPIISITYKEDAPIDIPNSEGRDVLHLAFSPGDDFKDRHNAITPKECQQIVEFLEKVKQSEHKILYIQCGEGMIRSYTLSRIIPNLDSQTVRDPSLAEVRDGIYDDFTGYQFFNYYMDNVNKDD